MLIFFQLTEDVIFKFLPDYQEIIFTKPSQDYPFIVHLITEQHSLDLHKYLTKSTTFYEFHSTLNEEAKSELKEVVYLLKTLQIVSEGKASDLQMDDIKPGQLILGQYFKLILNSFESVSVYASGDISVSEGANCSSMGDVRCGCGHDFTFYECISDGTWAGTGTSC